MQDEHPSEKDQKIAFELTCLLPKFWAISYEEGIIFSQSSKNLAMRYLSHLEIELSTLQNASINDNEMIDALLENLENKQWKNLEESWWQLEALYEKHKAAGYDVTDLKGLPGFPPGYYFIKDPDGYKIEVIRTKM